MQSLFEAKTFLLSISFLLYVKFLVWSGFILGEWWLIIGVRARAVNLQQSELHQCSDSLPGKLTPCYTKSVLFRSQGSFVRMWLHSNSIRPGLEATTSLVFWVDTLGSHTPDATGSSHIKLLIPIGYWLTSWLMVGNRAWKSTRLRDSIGLLICFCHFFHS